MKVTGQERTVWPVVEVEGRILWMRGVELEPDPSIRITAEPLSQQLDEGVSMEGRSSADFSS